MKIMSYKDFGTEYLHGAYIFNDKVMKISNDFKIVNGADFEDGYKKEFCLKFIVDDNAADRIKRLTDEPLYYSEALDMYVWGVETSDMINSNLEVLEFTDFS